MKLLDKKKVKDVSKCCNCNVNVSNGKEGTNYYIYDKCKQPCDVIGKTKELDWCWQKEFLSSGSMNGCGDLSIMISTVSNILTQQRTELLEEIKTRVDTFGGFEDDGGNLCHYDSEILEWVNDLLNKKDE